MKVLIPLLGQGRQYCLTLHFYTLYLFILMACAILAAMHFEVCSQGIVCWSHVCLKSNVLRCVLVLCGKYDFGVLFFYAVVMVNGHVFLSIHWSICLWAPSALPPLRASCLKVWGVRLQGNESETKVLNATSHCNRPYIRSSPVIMIHYTHTLTTSGLTHR